MITSSSLPHLTETCRNTGLFLGKLWDLTTSTIRSCGAAGAVSMANAVQPVKGTFPPALYHFNVGSVACTEAYCIHLRKTRYIS